MIPSMPVYGRHFEPGQLQFITTSTYRRLRLFDSQCFRWAFVEVLRELRQETNSLLIGWVLMPEHFHLLIKPVPAESTSRWMQELKKRTAQGIIATLKQNASIPGASVCWLAGAASKTRASEIKALWTRLCSTEHTSSLRPQGRVRCSDGAESVP